MSSSTQSRTAMAYRFVVSSFVVFALVFQAIISLGPLVGINIGAQYWPFVNYAMYSRSFEEGDTVEVYRILEGYDAAGNAVPIDMQMLGMHIWHYRKFVGDIEDGRPEAFEHLSASLGDDVELAGIRVLSFPVAVYADGPRERASELLADIPLTGEVR